MTNIRVISSGATEGRPTVLKKGFSSERTLSKVEKLVDPSKQVIILTFASMNVCLLG
jgi:hypothetical protein